MKIITVEEHFITSDHLNFLRSRKEFPKREIVEQENQRKIERIWYSPSCCFTVNDINGPDRFLTELGNKRLREMDKPGIGVELNEEVMKKYITPGKKPTVISV